MGTTGVLRDSYVGSLASASFIPQDDVTSVHPNQVHEPTAVEKPRIEKISRTKSMSAAWAPEVSDNQTDEDKIIHLTCPADPNSKLNPLEEYQTDYEGLSIIPWEDFVCNPRILNDLFYTESNHRITYDPEEVNAFFHGKNVLPPSVGDISENGKSWNICVDKVPDLRHVRLLLSERCSVFGLTLVYKQKRFSKPQRVPCLLLLDPSQGNLGDRIYASFTKAMDSLHRRRTFCLEINLNNCVERWCRRVLLTECKSVGARLVVTNGEEYTSLSAAEDIVCCVVCFPIWLLQACVYKLHRSVVYDDYFIKLDAEELFLHGTFLEPAQQRQQIFQGNQVEDVFRVRSVHQTDKKTLQNLGSYKFVCVKKATKGETEDDENIKIIKEHNTLPFNELMHRRKEKVLAKENKALKKQGISNKTKANNETDNAKESKSVSFTDDKKDIENNKEDTDALCQTSENIRSQKQDKGVDGGNINVAFDDDGNQSPRIPELVSVTVSHKDVKANTDAENSDSINCNALFTKQTDGHRSISPILQQNNAVLNEQSPEWSGDDTAIRKFEWNQSVDTESETETDEESSQDVQETRDSKANLLHTMITIEETLPTDKPVVADHRRDSIEKHPDSTDTEQGSKKNKKKKRKEKPKVGKVLKDLMKTTEASKESLPSQSDARFEQAKAKLKSQKTKKKHQKFTKEEKKDEPKDQIDETNKDTRFSESHKEVIDDSIMYFNDDTNSTTSNEDVNDVISDRKHNRDSIQRKQPNDANGSEDEIKQFKLQDTDESSTDGEVEMIYQSERKDGKNTVNGSFGTYKDTADVNHGQSDIMGLDNIVALSKLDSKNNAIILSSAKHVTDDDKMNDRRLPNRSTLFAKSQNMKTGTPILSTASGVTKRSIASSAEVSELEDIEFSDEEQVNQGQGHRSDVYDQDKRGHQPLTTDKKQRKTRRNTSQRKYLGTATTVKGKKHTK